MSGGNARKNLSRKRKVARRARTKAILKKQREAA